MADDGSSTLSISPADRDAMVRTVIGEATNQGELGQAAVAHTIMNRVIDGGYGRTPSDVVYANDGRTWQFEPWGSRASELRSISPNSRAYQAAAKVVDGVLSGDVPDPTNGAKNFLNPDTVMQRSGRLPGWASGDGVQIGAHVFLNGRGAAPADNAPAAIDSAIHAPPAAPQGTVAPGVLAFTASGAAPQGPQAQGQQAPPNPSVPPSTTGMSDADLETLLTGKEPVPAAPAQQPTPGVRFAAPADPASMSDQDLEHLLTSGGAHASGLKAAQSLSGGKGGAQPALTPQQVAAGRDPQTGELVVGGKPFTPDSGHWNALVNFANGGLQGAGTDLMAGVQALKEKLYNDNPLALKTLYDQAKSTYQGGREAYAAANPGTAAATEIGGSLATAVPAMAAGGASLAGVGNALIDSARAVPLLARAAPAAESVGSFLAGNAGSGAGVGNALVRGLSRATSGAIQGGTAAAISSGLSDQPFSDQVRQGAELGGVVGVGAPAAFNAVRVGVNRLLGAGSVSPETAALAKTAGQYGILVRAGQITDSPGVRFLDSTLSRTPGMGYGGEAAAQGTAFNRAVATTMGESADRITPAVMTSARARIGQALNDVAARTTIRQDQPFISDLTHIANEAHGVLADSELRPLQTQIQNVLSKFSAAGEMTGDAYQALTRTGAPLDRLQSSNDSNLRFYANRVRDALDDTMERSASPDVLAQLRQARGQYKAMKTIEPLVEKSTTGDVSPAGLMDAVRKKYDGMAYGGGGPLGDLARIGQKFLKEPPSSGTAERLQAQETGGKVRNALIAASGLGGAITGAKEALPFLSNYVSPETVIPTIAAMGGGFAGGRVASSILRSPAVANALIARALGQPAVPGAAGNALLTGIDVTPTALPIAYRRLAGPGSAPAP